MILMKNLILILIFAAVGLNTMASNPVHVIITAGQSNTDGRTPNEDLPAYIKALATDTLTYAEGAYRYCQIAQNDGKGEFIPFWPRAKRSGKNNMWAFDAVTYYWLEYPKKAVMARGSRLKKTILSPFSTLKFTSLNNTIPSSVSARKPDTSKI